MNNAQHAALIMASLERATATVEDLSPLVYPKFFQHYPEAEIEFGNDDDNDIKSRMLVNLLLELAGYAENKVYPGNILRWISDHKAYGATPAMYRCMLSCILSALQSQNGAAWTAATAAAWQAQFDKLMAHVDAAYA